jgi:hypothetical protein
MGNREPKVHVIDGVTYVEVDRKAEVGDKIIVIKDDEFMCQDHIGEIHEVTKLTKTLTYTTGKWDDGSTLNLLKEEYRVLEPLASEEVTVDSSQASEQVIASVDESQASAAVVNMFTALSRKIVSLERQLAATQRNLETFAEQTENNSEDIRTLDERTQVVNAIVKFYEGSRR